MQDRNAEVFFERDGESLRGFVAVPERDGPLPGLVLIPDVRGLYEHYRDVARRFAAGGYVTLAVDLYSREGTPELADLASVFEWMRSLPDGRILADLHAAGDYLSSRADVCDGAIGITGFCMGGQYALMAASSGARFAACVGWYGMLRYTERLPNRPRSPLDLAAGLACPYLGLFGEDDELIPAADIDELSSRLTHAGKDFEIVTYPGAGHAFMNNTRPDAFRADAAEDSFARALAFFDRHLRAT